MEKKLSTDPYKGVRGFYPEDMFVQNHIFGVMRKTAESFGYSEYNASVLEPIELYRAKSGNEIVNEQTYNFKDRGERDVTLHPEMTPTVARMIAGKQKTLSFPIRWFSIPNLFRYEQPQKGRLREHWQLNVDLFGSKEISADIEIISLAYSLMKNLGAKDDDFKILINNRGSIKSTLSETLGNDENKINQYLSLLDKSKKIGEKAFKAEQIKLFGVEVKYNTEPDNHSKNIISEANKMGISNIEFDPYLVRGFDYYTGMVFEVYDTNLENRRSIFGGGRYGNLTAIFGGEPVPAVGFGMGDVTAKDFLETHNLLPEYKPATDIYLCVIGNVSEKANEIANGLRKTGLNVMSDITGKKIGDQIKLADKLKIPFAGFVGESEIASGKIKIRNLKSRDEKEFPIEETIKIKEFVNG